MQISKVGDLKSTTAKKFRYVQWKTKGQLLCKEHKSVAENKANRTIKLSFVSVFFNKICILLRNSEAQNEGLTFEAGRNKIMNIDLFWMSLNL